MNIPAELLSSSYSHEGSTTIGLSGWPKEAEVCPNARSYRARNLRPHGDATEHTIHMRLTTHLN
jgi:hypothetical protein